MESRYIKGIKTIFVPAKAEGIDIIPVLKKLKLSVKRVGLISAIQYIDYLTQAKEFLEEKGFEVIIAGQMVGCNTSNAIKIKDKVDAYLFLGSGEFHPLELVNYSGISEIYLVNPVSQNITKFKKEDLEILERKTEELENILKNYQIIKFPPKAKQNIVDLGAKVFLEDSSGQKVKFQIVGTLEANPFLEKISNESPVGKALLGCKVGEKVDIDSPVKLEYKILKITYEES